MAITGTMDFTVNDRSLTWSENTRNRERSCYGCSQMTKGRLVYEDEEVSRRTHGKAIGVDACVGCAINFGFKGLPDDPS